MASSSSSHKRSEVHPAVSLLEPHALTRKAEESVRLYDVFINHRGPDVKKTLAFELYEFLEKFRIRAFLDSEEKELGDSFPSTIRTAIRSARVHIAIFSKGYAESPWCLEELSLMMETEASIIPLFYEVKPWELRHIEKGSYDQAFKDHEKKSRHKEKLKKWTEALDRMSYVAGYETNKENAASDCKRIVSAVQKQMQRIKFLHVAKHPVGLSKLVKELERRCLRELLQDLESQHGMNEDGQGKVRIVSIYGMGGTGKTTLSKELFNKYCLTYTRTSFLFDVREASSRNALPSLQLKLLKDLFDEDHPSFTSTGEGISCLQDRLGRIESVSFLIVLDDIDHSNQLDNLLVTDMLNKSGNSLIIITTRDYGVLKRAEIPTPYNLEGIDESDARELFCLHAFGKSNPARGYESLVEAFVKECGRIPLSLQILGSHVKGEDEKFWSSALKKVRRTLPQEIKQKLKISFESLDSEEKQIFMDIACFFIGKSKNMAIKVWEGSGWEAHHALETLKQKCLVQEIENKHLDGLQWEGDGIALGMHDHLRDLGREMADECRFPRRIWKPEGLKSLESKEGFGNNIGKAEGRCFHSMFETSTGYQITYFLDESASLLSVELDLNSREDTCIPSWIPLQKLQCLRISNGRLERLWHDSDQAPLQLKELQISKTFLKEVTDLEVLINLENVVLDAKYMSIGGWSLLESIRMNISTLISLMPFTLEGKLSSTNGEEWATLGSLIIRNFKQSTEVALNEYQMSRLKSLEIGNQKSVTKILISGNHCPGLETLKLHQMEDLIEIDLDKVTTLNSLEVNHCENFKILTFSECHELQELSLSYLDCLETIRIGNLEQLRSVSGLSYARKLVMFNISQCHVLQELSLSYLDCLERIAVNSCRKLKCLELIHCEKLVELNIYHCPELERELSFSSLRYLKRIRIENCKHLKRVSGISDLTKLVELNISECQELESELRLPSLHFLKRIKVDRCRRLKCLELIDCIKLETVSGMEGLEELAILNIRACPELLQLPAHILSCRLERMTIDGCEKLNYRAFYSLLNLKIVTFDIGRAVEGAESILNSDLFSRVFGTDAVTEMDVPHATMEELTEVKEPEPTCSRWERVPHVNKRCVVDYNALSVYRRRPGTPQTSMSKIIVCGLVVVERSTPQQYINYGSQELHLPKGRWIFTMVIEDPKRNTSFISSAVEGMCYGIVDKGFRVTLMKGQEGKTGHVLQTIDKNLDQNKGN